MERIVITKDGRAITQTFIGDWVESLVDYHEAMRLIAALDTLGRYGRDESGKVKA